MTRIYLAGPDVFLPDAVDVGRRKVALCAQHGLIGLYPLENAVDRAANDASLQIFRGNEAMMIEADASGLTVEDFGLADNLMMIHALDLHGCALAAPRQAPADIWHDLTAFESCVRMAAERVASVPARASS